MTGAKELRKLPVSGCGNKAKPPYCFTFPAKNMRTDGTVPVVVTGPNSTPVMSMVGGRGSKIKGVDPPSYVCTERT